MGNIITTRTRALRFHSTSLQVIRRDGEVWLRLPQIEGALGYKHKGKALSTIFDRNRAEFTDRMTQLVKLPTAGGEQEVRVFSLRGAHLLAMFARTERAAEFRRWVLDMLDQVPATAAQPPRPPVPPSAPPAIAPPAPSRSPAPRWLITVGPDGLPLTQVLAPDVVVGTWAEIANLVRHRGVPRDEVMGLAEAATRAAFGEAANSPKGDGDKIARAIESAGEALALADLQAIATAATMELWARARAHRDGSAGTPGSGILELMSFAPGKPSN